MQSASEIAEAVRNGRTTASAVLDAALARIDALDDDLQAWVELDRTGSRRAAELQPSGALAGVPVGVKDIIDVGGLPSRLGAGAFAHSKPTQDSGPVARLRAAGALVLGKTHTTQFAYLDPAPTRNPWHRDRTPGGSSSGSAAAVAAGMVPMALGSQTVGSVLRPAAYCGVVGFKPSFGRIAYTGTAALAPSFDHIGVLCRSVADAALALSVLAGYDAADPNAVEREVDDYLAAVAGPQPPRIALARLFYEAESGAEVVRHLGEVAESLSATGATVVEVDMPATARQIADMGQPVLRSEAAQVHAKHFEAHRYEYGPQIRALIESGLGVASADVFRARNELRSLRAALSSLLSEYDCILMPVAPATAPGRETTGNSIFCAAASFTGLPAIALPSGLGADGLPLSVQLVAGPFAEARLLAAAAWVERVLDFHAEPSLAAP
ncbi:MAG TPA: amidase [Dehalococcoidia bacterium]|nr:amidase [Dehalococcoidia bacterium]